MKIWSSGIWSSRRRDALILEIILGLLCRLQRHEAGNEVEGVFLEMERLGEEAGQMLEGVRER